VRHQVAVQHDPVVLHSRRCALHDLFEVVEIPAAGVLYRHPCAGRAHGLFLLHPPSQLALSLRAGQSVACPGVADRAKAAFIRWPPTSQRPYHEPALTYNVPEP
jgi:hypothetical protein